MSKAIAIITARGGSKRIPKKNIKEFCGKPIIAYTIQAALDCGMFDEVMVSTDSEEIADIARKYGANVPFFRSEETSSDYATTVQVLNEVIGEYEKRGQNFDLLCCLYPVAPFITAERLHEAVEAMDKAGAASLVPVVRFSCPPQQGLVIKDGRLFYQFPQYRRMRSQDLEPIYHDCGQFYFCKMDAYRQYGVLITPDTLPFPLSEDEVQDIDNMTDWHIAEAKFRVLHDLL